MALQKFVDFQRKYLEDSHKLSLATMGSSKHIEMHILHPYWDKSGITKGEMRDTFSGTQSLVIVFGD